MTSSKPLTIPGITRYILLSTSAIKSAAVKAVTGADPVLFDAGDTGVAQPLYLSGARECTQTRIDAYADELRQLPNDTAVVVVENFIDIEGRPEEYFDRALVTLLTAHGHCRMEMLSARVSVPKKWATKMHRKMTADANWTKTSTLGQLIATETGKDCSKDWFQVVCKTSITRQQQITRAVTNVVREVSSNRELLSRMRIYQDFPKPDVAFADVFHLTSAYSDPLIYDAVTYAYAALLGVRNEESHPKADRIHEAINTSGEEVLIAGLESRGAMFGMGLAFASGHRFVPIRKPGKLAGKVLSETYEKEYGSDTIEVCVDHLIPESASIEYERVVIVDDVIATGGSVIASVKLLRKAGVEVPIDVLVITDVPALRPTWTAAMREHCPDVNVRLVAAASQ